MVDGVNRGVARVFANQRKIEHVRNPLYALLPFCHSWFVLHTVICLTPVVFACPPGNEALRSECGQIQQAGGAMECHDRRLGKRLERDRRRGELGLCDRG